MNGQQVADQFYQAFARKDAAAMSQCYSPDVVFSDPVFPELKGSDVGAMWKMLCQNGRDLRVEHVILSETGDEVKVRWDAWYSFSKTGRPVHNIIVATMDIRDGKIVRHRDDFSFWRWSRQALGPIGLLLGWTPMIRTAVQRTAAQSLAKSKSKF